MDLYTYEVDERAESRPRGIKKPPLSSSTSSPVKMILSIAFREGIIYKYEVCSSSSPLFSCLSLVMKISYNFSFISLFLLYL